MKTRDLSRVFTRREEKNIKPYQVRLPLQPAQWGVLSNYLCITHSVLSDCPKTILKLGKHI